MTECHINRLQFGLGRKWKNIGADLEQRRTLSKQRSRCSVDQFYLGTLHLHQPFSLIRQTVHTDRFIIIIGIGNEDFPHVNTTLTLLSR